MNETEESNFIIFLSWSHPLSNDIALLLKEFLPRIIPGLKDQHIFYSPESIEKSNDWEHELLKAIKHQKLGIFIITQDNLDSSWLHYELGAISQNQGLICPLLVDLTPEQLTGPFCKYQVTILESKEDFKKLMKKVNDHFNLGDVEQFEKNYERYWNELKEKVEFIIVFHKNVKNITSDDLHSLTHIVNQKEDQIISAIIKAMKQYKPPKHDEDKRFFLSKAHKILTEYYPERDLNLHNAYFWRLSPNSENSVIITKPTWENLNLPLSKENEFFTYIELSNIPKLELNDITKAAAVFFSKEGKRWNQPLYVLIDLSFDESQKKINMKFSKEYFFIYRYTMGFLVEELNAYIYQNPKTAELELRNKLLPNVETLFNFKDRICGGGTNILLAMLKEDKNGKYFEIPVYRRSNLVTNSQGLMSIVPKGFHSPHSLDDAKNVNIWYNIIREYYEELFKQGKEVEKIDDYTDADWIFDAPEINNFTRAGNYEMEITSIGINALHGNYEISVLLMIEDPNILHYYPKSKPNWEWETNYQKIHSKDAKKIEEIINNEVWAEESLFAFIQGLKRLKAKRNDLVNLPNNAIFYRR